MQILNLACDGVGTACELVCARGQVCAGGGRAGAGGGREGAGGGREGARAVGSSGLVEHLKICTRVDLILVWEPRAVFLVWEQRAVEMSRGYVREHRAKRTSPFLI